MLYFLLNVLNVRYKAYVHIKVDIDIYIIYIKRNDPAVLSGAKINVHILRSCVLNNC